MYSSFNRNLNQLNFVPMLLVFHFLSPYQFSLACGDGHKRGSVGSDTPTDIEQAQLLRPVY